MICRTKKEGGLRVKDLKLFYIALLGKWKWRLSIDVSGLWKEVLVAKYRSWRELDHAKDGYHDSLWWRDIKRACGEGKEGNWFNKNIIWRRGKGNKIMFWDDK